jgi:hypothetical protein
VDLAIDSMVIFQFVMQTFTRGLTKSNHFSWMYGEGVVLPSCFTCMDCSHTHTWNDTLSAISFSFKQMNNKQPSCGSLHVDNCVETIQPTVCTQVFFFSEIWVCPKKADLK